MNIIAYMFYMMALWGYRNKDNVAINFAEVLSSDIAKLSPWLIEIEHGWLAYIEYAQVKRYKGLFFLGKDILVISTTRLKGLGEKKALDQ